MGDPQLGCSADRPVSNKSISSDTKEKSVLLCCSQEEKITNHLGTELLSRIRCVALTESLFLRSYNLTEQISNFLLKALTSAPLHNKGRALHLEPAHKHNGHTMTMSFHDP